MSCSDVVNKSNGILDAELCSSLSKQILLATKVVNDISANTTLFTINTIDLGIPVNTKLLNPVISFVLPSILPSQLRHNSYKWYNNPAPGVDLPWVSTSGPNNALYVIKNYLNGSSSDSMANRSLGGAKGTVISVGMVLGFPLYDISPWDVNTANTALGLPSATFVNLTDPPFYTANIPTAVYGFNRTRVDPDNDFVEAALDAQMMSQYSNGSGAQNGIFGNNVIGFEDANNATNLAGQLEMLLLQPPPSVISLSIGGSMAHSYNLYNSLAKLAAQGITVIAASGDTGAYQGPTGSYGCKSVILPSWLAASPWVTAVGAVMPIRTSPDNPNPQLVSTMTTAGALITSAGGFSLLSPQYVPSSPIPPWQAKVVNSYINSQSRRPSWPLNVKTNPLANYSMNCSSYDPVSGLGKDCKYGRGYPDLSMLGHNIMTITSGQPSFIDGTSCAAPAFAGVVAQLNSAVRSTPGLENRTMGWMNPFLYWAAEIYPKAFTDITVGSNNRAANGNVCLLGYRAAPGWDAVTGLGVPNISLLQQAAVHYVTLQVKGEVKPYSYPYYQAQNYDSSYDYGLYQTGDYYLS